MEVVDILEERDRLLKSLDSSYSELWRMGRELADCENEYKKAYRKEVFRLVQVDKCAWTAAITLAHGDTEHFDVADLRFKRDVAKSDYEVSIEKVNGLKLSIRTLEAEINRQWGKSGG